MNINSSISDLSAFNTQARQNLNVKSSLFDLGQKLSSGQYAAKDISRVGQERMVLAIDSELSLLSEYSKSANALAFRLETTQASLETIRQTSFDVATSVLASTMDQGTSAQKMAASAALGALDQIASVLNKSSNGEGLFSGASLNTGAVSNGSAILSDISALINGSVDAATAITAVDAYFYSVGGTYETTVYTGSTTPAPTVSVGENQSVTSKVSALSPEVRTSIRNMAIIASVANGAMSISTDEQKKLLLDASSDQVNNNSGLIRLQESVGFDQEAVENALNSNQTQKFAIEQRRSTITSVDLYETAAYFEEMNTQLQAVYQVTARLTSLSLSNFLR